MTQRAFLNSGKGSRFPITSAHCNAQSTEHRALGTVQGQRFVLHARGVVEGKFRDLHPGFKTVSATIDNPWCAQVGCVGISERNFECAHL